MTGRTDDEGQIDDELRSGDIGQDVQQVDPTQLEEIFEVRGDTTGADPDGIDPVVIRPHEPGHLT